MAILTTNNLVKVYSTPEGDILAIDDLNIEVPKGATALLGPNGSGKSTLIKIVLGLIKATSGTYKIFGKGKEGERSMAQNRIGYMPETPSIVSKVNAVKFVRHFGILSGLSFTRAMQRAHEVLDYVGLEESRYREIDKYSTGMKQRLLFAQALVHDPDLVILDEPTSGLSPEGRQEMLGLIKEINREYDKSILFSTHILPDVENICNYTILLNRGHKVFQGSTEEIQNLYQETLLIEVSSEFEIVKTVLREKGLNAYLDGRLIRILVNNEQELPTFKEIVNLLTGYPKIEVLSMRHHRPNLEDLFMNTIKKDIDQY